MMQKDIRSYLLQTFDLLEREAAQRKKVMYSESLGDLRSRIDAPLPRSGQSFSELLQDLEDHILPFLNRNTNSRYAAYITGSGNPVAAIAKYIKAHYNQNGLKWNSSPIACELEHLVVHWIADFIQQPAFHLGYLTSGGSMSNFLAVHFALAAAFPERELHGIYAAPRIRVYGSDQTHSSIERALVFLGIGRQNFVKIPVDASFAIDLPVLRKAIEQDIAQGFRPLMIVGNAGTTNTGSIDNLAKLAKIAAQYQLWYHVDGAYGLPAIRLSELTDRFKGTEQADSIIVNPHKWMYVPFEASCILLKQPTAAINFAPAYLQGASVERWESSTQTVELSKEFRALKIWFTLKFYGADQIAHFIRSDIELVQYMADLLQESAYYVVEPEHPLSILCFRIEKAALSAAQNEQLNVQALAQIEQDRNYFLTGTNLYDKTYLRIYFGNPLRTKAEVTAMVKYLEELAAQIDI